MGMIKNIKTNEIYEVISLEKTSGGGGGSSTMFCGLVVGGGTFPTTRPDGSALVMGDYVKPDPSSTFPITVTGMGSSCVFNSARDTGVYLSTGWVVNANPYQNTAETPILNKSTESISGTANFQNAANVEFKAAIENKVEQSTSTSGALVYGRNNTTETTFGMSALSSANTIAKRYTDGRLKVGTPVDNADAATKAYVDSKSAQVDNVTVDLNAAGEVEIKDSGVTTAKIADSNVTTAKLADDSVTTDKIVDSNVTADKLANNSVTTAKIVDNNVTTAKLANNSVTTAKIVDANVTEDKLAEDSVTTDKIVNANVTTAKLANLGVTTPKIADDAVTIDKIADSSIATSIDTPSVDTKLATQKAVKDGLDLKQDSLIAGDNIEIEADGKTINSNQIDDTLTASTVKTYSVNKIKEEIRINAATFRGAFATKADLDAYTGTAEKNDRAVVTVDETHSDATTMYAYSGSAWVFEYVVSTKALELDDLTINYNSSGKLQVKNGDDTNGLTIAKLKHVLPADSGKTNIVQADGSWALDNIRQYRQVSTFAGETGNNYTFYYLDTPIVIGTTSYEKGNYVWDATNGFSLVANVGSGGTTPIYCGIVAEGGSFPATRPDGEALIAGDYVKPDSEATFPYTIGSVTFTSPNDSAVCMSLGNWILNASVYQKTNQTPVNDKTTESINGATSTAQYQNQINIENVAELKKRLVQFSTMPTASATYADNKIYQYIGSTTASYIKGHFYNVVVDSSVSPVTYSWAEVVLGITDYDELTNRPQINSKVLTGDKNSFALDITWEGTEADYTALATKNLYTIYGTEDGDTPVTNSYYTQAEVNALLLDKQDKTDTTLGTVTKNLIEAVNQIFNDVKVLSGVVKVEVVETQPSAPVNNTMYYIGTTNPYTVKLYTESKGWTDLGTTEIDLSEYQKSTVSLAEFTATTIEGMLVELKTLCDAKINTTSIVNNLTSTSTTAPLSANMGKYLNDNKQSKVTISSSSPSGGNDGDIWVIV